MGIAPRTDVPRTELTEADRAVVERLAARLGVQRLARELGIARTSVGSLLARTETKGTRAIVVQTLPRLLTELAAHDEEAVLCRTR